MHDIWVHWFGVLIAVPGAAVVFKASWRSFNDRPRRRIGNRK
jgi:hypothetical protein